MHALRAFIQDEMDRRSWRPADLVRASGLTKQTIHGMLADDRPQLTMRIEDRTADGLAKAFHVDRQVILAKVGEAMGLPVSEPVVIYDASRVSDEELIRVLAERLAKAGEHRGDTAPMNDERAPIRSRRAKSVPREPQTGPSRRSNAADRGEGQPG